MKVRVFWSPERNCRDCNGSGWKTRNGLIEDKCKCWHRVELGKRRKIYRGADGKARAAGE